MKKRDRVEQMMSCAQPRTIAAIAEPMRNTEPRSSGSRDHQRAFTETEISRGLKTRVRDSKRESRNIVRN